jgi:drug/metabolite transporter (DMT)-like permease
VKPRDALLLLLLAGIWGAAFLFIRVVVREVQPSTVVAGRLLIAAIVVAPLAARRGGVLPRRGLRGTVLFLALFNNVIPFTLITIAEKHITGGLAATLVATMPLFTVLFAYGAGAERPNAERIAGLLIGFAGAAVVVGPDLGDVASSSTVGDVIVIVAAACYALSTVVARQTRGGEPLSLASGQMIFGAMIAVPLAFFFDGVPNLGISAEAALAWVGLGTLCSGLAYIIFFSLVQRSSATQVSLVSYLIPFVAALLGWAVLGESIGVNLFIGLVLIVVGVAGVNGGLRWTWERLRGGGPADAGAGAQGG